MHTQAISIVSICGLDTRVVMCDVCTGLRGHAGKASPSSQIRSLIAHLSLNPVCAIYCATLGILFNFSIHMFPLMEIMDRRKRNTRCFEDWMGCGERYLSVCSNSCSSSQRCHPTISSLSSPSPPAFNLSQHQGLFQWISLPQVDKVLELLFQHQSFQRIFMTDFL